MPKARRPDGSEDTRYVSDERLRRAIAVRFLVGDTWEAAARESGISKARLQRWHGRKKDTPNSIRWHSMLALMEKERDQSDADGEPVESGRRQVVTIGGFKSPEQLCDHYAMEAARVQIETMLDPDATRRDRNDAAGKVLALGGHSPVTKSVVVSAPLNDPKVVAILQGVLGEIGEARRQTNLLAEFTGGDPDEEPPIEVEPEAPPEAVSEVPSGVPGET